MTNRFPRSALVTGASRGIGREIALDLARRGARVALLGRSVDGLQAVHAEIEAIGGEALIITADVRSPHDVDAAVATTVAEFGSLEILCANSGVAGPTAPLWEISLDEWNETFAVNVVGTFLCCHAVVPVMAAAGRGNIVVVGSVTGKRALSGRSPYAASKTALIGLVRTLAVEVGPLGIRVNLVSPGPVSGPRLDAVVERQASARSVSAADVRAELLAQSAVPRFVDAVDVARTVAFLASEDASGITGQDINVANGAVMS